MKKIVEMGGCLLVILVGSMCAGALMVGWLFS
jgi:hypothetical protein